MLGLSSASLKVIQICSRNAIKQIHKYNHHHFEENELPSPPLPSLFKSNIDRIGDLIPPCTANATDGILIKF